MLSSDSYVRVMVSLRLYVEVKNVSVYLWFSHLNLSLWYFRTAIELGKFILLILTKVLNYFCKKDWLAYVFCPRGVSHKKNRERAYIKLRSRGMLRKVGMCYTLKRKCMMSPS